MAALSSLTVIGSCTTAFSIRSGSEAPDVPDAVSFRASCRSRRCSIVPDALANRCCLSSRSWFPRSWVATYSDSYLRPARRRCVFGLARLVSLSPVSGSVPRCLRRRRPPGGVGTPGRACGSASASSGIGCGCICFRDCCDFPRFARNRPCGHDLYRHGPQHLGAFKDSGSRHKGNRCGCLRLRLFSWGDGIYNKRAFAFRFV